MRRYYEKRNKKVEKTIEKNKGQSDGLPTFGNPEVGNKIFTGKAWRCGSFVLNNELLED